MGFVKNIFQGNIDENVHSQFIRFGRGEYEGRALISCHKTSKLKLKSSFEYCNNFVYFISNLGNFNFKGTIICKEEVKNLGPGGKKKGGAFFYEVDDVSSEKIIEIKNKVSYLLLNCESEKVKLKMKKKLPKPGKPADKVDNKFCQLEIASDYFQKIKDEFFWDLADFKKIKIKHKFIIKDIVYPKDEKDFEKIRLLSKRKGKIIREIEVDGKNLVREADFEA